MKPEALKQPRKSFQKGGADLKRYIGLYEHYGFYALCEQNYMLTSNPKRGRSPEGDFVSWLHGRVAPGALFIG